ncbi:hypothetical protein B0F90DRAFT_1813642 [Multifurca ochricompacta]|uniref:F-box domain-containing protein n=1 Tax=Multifurca ochricompacta TaxID=376703 RepID=A0AAD4MDI9_9AGAM|nr:hypothetical protein B0F90DRAFT_1813642 [Multifurca ochricompacta]
MTIPKVTFTPRLPVELWLHVFRFATSAPTSLSFHYEPFQSSHDSAPLSDAALRDKCALTLVCKQWRQLAKDILYEDIRIGHGISLLHATLDQHLPDGLRGPRHHVRRAVLPYAHTATPTSRDPPALALLSLLPHLEVLVRPPIHPFHSILHPPFEFPTTAPAFPTLRRLEWAFDFSGAAARTGGINALNDVLMASPALRELVLVGQMPFAALCQRRLHMRALRTLRLSAGAGMCPLVARQTTYWALPALENVVVEGCARAGLLEAVWEAFGEQIRVLELGRGVPMQDVGKFISACSALEELNLYRIGFCVDAGESWDDQTWSAVLRHVEKVGEGCPALREAVLYTSDLPLAAKNPHFHALHETFLSSGRQLLLRSLRA